MDGQISRSSQSVERTPDTHTSDDGPDRAPRKSIDKREYSVTNSISERSVVSKSLLIAT
jgi:hypothetical protein